MKLTLILMTLTLSVSAFAETKRLNNDRSYPHVSNVTVEEIADRIETECYSENIFSSGGCFEEAKSRKVVTVQVEYTVQDANFIDQIDEVTANFSQHLDASLFSNKELDRLADQDYQSRMKAAKKLIDLKIQKTMSQEFGSAIPVLDVEVVRK